MLQNKAKIAILGAGFSGLALSWFLLNTPNPPEVTLISNGNEASRMSAGILHKYMGLHAKLNPLANEAEKEAQALLAACEPYATSPLILNQGLIRIALTEQQITSYQKCTASYPDVKWLDNCQSLDRNAPPYPGIFIESGLTVNAKEYIDALQRACIEKGLLTEFKTIRNQDSLAAYDHIIGAMGALTPSLEPFQTLPIHPLKGQLIEIQWPKDLPPLPHTLISQVYMAMSEDNTKVIVGATYEHHFDSPAPNPQLAIDFLLPKALELYPPLAGMPILAVTSGIRGTTPTRLPFAKVLSPRFSILAGMGSRGLLYHAYFAKQLAVEIVNSLNQVKL
jgi:glycine/D-amino acid oxidase-like deaminating enzyme